MLYIFSDILIKYNNDINTYIHICIYMNGRGIAVCLHHFFADSFVLCKNYYLDCLHVLLPTTCLYVLFSVLKIEILFYKFSALKTRILFT